MIFGILLGAFLMRKYFDWVVIWIAAFVSAVWSTIDALYGGAIGEWLAVATLLAIS